MSNSIRLRDYQQEIDTLQPGETKRIDHDTCDAGRDTRQRLYITRVMADPTVVLGYCHNCQKPGKLTIPKYKRYRDSKHAPKANYSPSIVDVIQEPPNLVHHPNNWPTNANIWRMKNGLTLDMVNFGRIAYDPTSDRIYLPEYFSNDSIIYSKLEGYQLRKINDDNTPKYVTCRTTDSIATSFITQGTTAGKIAVVIVEDLVSGIHVANASPNFIACVNYGTKVNVEQLSKLDKELPVVVWLDNDSNHVREQGYTIARTASLLGLTANQTASKSDPKHYSTEDIWKEINKWIP